MKLLEIADLHLDPKWLELQKPCLELIKDTAFVNEVDFICIAGDVYNRPFYNSDKDRLNYVLNYFEELLTIAPVVMITGTPSHDAPGSYLIFEKMGCHVIKPNIPEIINDVLFIGLPEIDKIALMARNKMSLKEADVYIMKSLNQYIEKYWVPVREVNKEKPCIFLGHGVFVDDVEKSKKNPIIKNSDFVINNNILKTIKADRYIFGHFHTPEVSKVVNGGYVGFAGFDKAPWNCTGFQPGFNLVDIIQRPFGERYEDDVLFHFHAETTRISYPVTRKEKRNIKYNPAMKLNTLAQWHNCDVRLNMEISKSELRGINIEEMQKKYVEDFSLNSCTIIPQLIREESDRITIEQAEELNTDWKKYAFYKKWNPDDESKKSIFIKFEEMIDNVNSRTLSKEKKDIYLLDATIHGSIFSKDAHNKNTLHYDFRNDPHGLTLVSGDNGKCKSTFLGFLLPYPYFVGFDYRTLKEFFIDDDAYIEKNFSVNGIRHQHLIYIPEKKSIRCYWNIEGPDGKLMPALKTDKLSDFMEACEKFYGPLDSFISTCFHAQEPHRMKKYVSSLASSTSTDLRNAYMNIIGISREAEREYAKQRKKEIETEIHDLETQKNTMNNFIVDNETVYAEKNKIETNIKEIEDKINKERVDLKWYEEDFRYITVFYGEQKRLESVLELFKNNLEEKNKLVEYKQSKLKEFASINIEELKKQIADNDKIKSEIEKSREVWQNLNTEKNRISKEIETLNYNKNRKESELIAVKHDIEKNQIEIKRLGNENELLYTPCVFCKKLNPENHKSIKQNSMKVDELEEQNKKFLSDIKKIESEIEQLEGEIQTLKLSLSDVDTKLQNITNEGNTLKLQLLSPEKIQAINNKINEYSQFDIIKSSINELETEIKKLTDDIGDKQKLLNPFIAIQYENTNSELQKIIDVLNTKNNELSKQTGLLEAIKTQIEKIEKYKTELEIVLKSLDEKVIDLVEWESLYDDMSSNKFPALELDLITKEIDFEVNKTLNEKFIIETKTQYLNDKNEIIDGFSIMVYNPQSGIEKELLQHSPGQRATYFNEPIMEALRKRRQRREGVIFHWSVLDEADNPIKSDHILDYYMLMSNSIGQDHTRFVVSQKKEAYSLISNTIEIDKVACDLSV